MHRKLAGAVWIVALWLDLTVASAHATIEPVQAENGALMLFDEESTIGWQVEGDAKVDKGMLIIGGKQATKLTRLKEFTKPFRKGLNPSMFLPFTPKFLWANRYTGSNRTENR